MNHYDHRLQISAIQPALSGLLFAWRKVMTATEKDRDILARTLWGGARGESLAGQIAVAWTIRSRVDDGNVRYWGEGYVGVCREPYQFSCRNKNDLSP